MRTVRTISLWQPWASLMARGIKFLETRSWDTNVRGEILIHASKTDAGIIEVDYNPPVAAAIERALGIPIEKWKTSLPMGAVIASGNLVETLTTDQGLIDYPDQEPFGNFAPRRFCHRYENLQPLQPIPLRGRQGFFWTELP